MGDVVPTAQPALEETAVVVPLNPTSATVGTGAASGNESNEATAPDSTANSASAIGLGIVFIGSLILGGVVIFILRLRTP